MVTSPSGDWSILSMPLGPSEVRRMRATALAAAMLAFCASSPLRRDLFSCSRRMMKGRPNSSKASAMAAACAGARPAGLCSLRDRTGQRRRRGAGRGWGKGAAECGGVSRADCAERGFCSFSVGPTETLTSVVRLGHALSSRSGPINPVITAWASLQLPQARGEFFSKIAL
jgi:hypothetical protein